MKDLKYIAGEISKGKNLDINLEKYATGMCSFYNTLACIKLAMNYYTVYDMYNEQPVKEPLFSSITLFLFFQYFSFTIIAHFDKKCNLKFP